MCIAICLSKPNIIIPDDILENCYSNNGDGAGFSVVDDNGELNSYKGFFSLKDFIDAYTPFKGRPACLHFRISTSAMVNGENCHPFRVSNDLVFSHNGIISGELMHKNTQLSDTGNFNDEILKPLYKANPNFYKMDAYKWMLQHSIGNGSKLIFMNDKNEFSIINEKAGNWGTGELEGVWFSNGSYKYSNGRGFRNQQQYSENWQTNNFRSVGHDQGNLFIEDQNDIEEQIGNLNDDFETLDLDEVDARLEAAQLAQSCGC